jgi:hypothetical protein
MFEDNHLNFEPDSADASILEKPRDPSFSPKCRERNWSDCSPRNRFWLSSLILQDEASHRGQPSVEVSAEILLAALL